MKYIRQFGIILAVTFVGELLHALIPLPVPASIYGMVLLFLLLCSGKLRLEQVKDVGLFLVEIMPLMFIPAAVGLLETWPLLADMLLPAAVITVVITILVMGITGLVTQLVIRKGGRKS